MKLEYSLNENDYLQYQLYTASKSKLIKKNRFRSRLIAPLALILFGLYNYINNPDKIGFIIYLLFAILWFFIHPLYSKFLYKRQYKRSIKENYQESVNKVSELSFNPNYILTKDYINESKINTKELGKLIEIKNYFFLTLNDKLSLVIPKNSISDIDSFKKIINEYNIEHLRELNWKWK